VTPFSTVAVPVFADSFSRTDGTALPPPWQVLRGAVTVQSGRSLFSAITSGARETLATVAGLSATDVRVQADVTLNSSTYAGLAVRHTVSAGKDTFYAGYLIPITGGARGEIWKSVAGVWTRIGSSGTVATSGGLQFEAVGTKLTLSLGGTAIATATDAAIAGPGSAGLYAFGAGTVGATVDNLAISRLENSGLPQIALASDTGPGTGDWITKTGTVNVSGLNGVFWEWSSDAGNTWTTGAGTSFTLVAGTYAAGAVRVRPVLMSVNITQNSTPITVDATVPAAPILTRSGTTATMLVSGLETGAAWKYSTDNGATWTAGPGTGSFTLPAGAYLPSAIRVVQTDLAGNDSPFTGNTTAILVEAAGIAAAFSDSFARPDGTPLLTPWRFATGTAAIASGRLAQSTTAESVAVVDGLSTADVRVQATVNVATATQVGLVARVGGGTATSPSLYLAYLVKTATGANAEIWRRLTSGTGTTTWKQFGTTVAAPATTGTLKFHVVGTTLSLSFNDVPLIVAQDTQVGAPATGTAGVWLKGGSGGSIDDFSIADVPPTGSIAFRLQTDSGASSGDSITNLGLMNVTGLDSSATWRWTTDGGTTWTPGTGTTFTLPAGSYDAGSVRVEQLTPASKLRQNVTRIVVDATAPAAPGFSRTGTIVTVTGLETGASWKYSLDSGTTWTAGKGTSFGIPVANYAAGQIRATQTDLAGNEGAAGQLPAITVTATSLVTDNFNRPDGTTLGTATGASGAWVAAAGAFRLASGAIQSTTAGTTMVVLPGFAEADVRVAAKIDVGASTGAGVVARSSGTGATANMLLGYVSRTVSGASTTFRAEIWRQKNGVWTLLSAAAVGTGAGSLQLDCVGTTATLSFNGSAVASSTDTSTSAVTAAGTAGLRFGGTAAKTDDFAASRLGM
jgi:hypothetical protein